MNIDTVDLKREIFESSKRLVRSTDVIYALANTKNETERDYRLALAREIMELRAEGLQATLIPDVARGNTAELKFKRDLARDTYNTARDSTRSLQAQLSGLQSILKTQDEI